FSACGMAGASSAAGVAVSGADAGLDSEPTVNGAGSPFGAMSLLSAGWAQAVLTATVQVANQSQQGFFMTSSSFLPLCLLEVRSCSPQRYQQQMADNVLRDACRFAQGCQCSAGRGKDRSVVRPYRRVEFAPVSPELLQDGS